MTSNEPLSTRLPREAYVAHLRTDSDRILACWQQDPDAGVPGCPGWTTTDLLHHVGSVFGHKLAALRTGAEPAEGSWQSSPADGEDPATWFRALAADLAEQLARRDPAEPTWSWWPAEQTVGFWQRRMAQEALVHRVDAESAVGAVGPVDPTLARDGVDELLGWLAWPWDDLPLEAADGRGVAVVAESGGATGDEHGHAHATVWGARFTPTRVTLDAPVEVDAGHVGAAVSSYDAVVSAPPAELLLRLWGRQPDGGRTLGDEEVLGWLDARLRLATS